jgi:chromatin remodeling complex protein RSC6
MPSTTAAKKQNTTPENKSVAAKVPEKVVEKVPEKVAEKVAEKVPEKVVEKVAEKVVEPVVPAVKKTRAAKVAATTVTKVEEPSAAVSSGEEAVEPVDDVIKVLVDKIGSLAGIVKDIQTSLKPVLKEHDKLKKIVERIQKKRDNARKSPSGFAKPNKISDELCDFIGVPHGTEKSRTDITRYINAYVKEHNLNKPTNRRVIIPDEKLKKIFKITNDEEVTFFVLQRLISHHFPTAGSKVVPAPAPVVEGAAT